MPAAVSSVPRLTFFANDGTPLNGGLVYTYGAGTLVAKTFYSDESKTVPISNPIVLNAAGRPQASALNTTEVNLYYTGSAKFRVYNSLSSFLYESDNIEEVAVVGALATLAFPVTVTGGVSGGIPYFSSTTAMAASGLLTNHGVVLGQGAATAPVATAAGAAGYPLVGNGAAADPTFQSPGSVGASQILLATGSGTDASATATNVATVAITGLTAMDTLMVITHIETVTANTGVCMLYNNTDGVQAAYLGANGAITATQGDWLEECFFGPKQSDTKKITTFTTGGSSNNTDGKVSGQFTYTTDWTGNWTLALRHGGVTATGTFKWRWTVYRILGQ